MKILMIVTSHDKLGNTGNATGLFLSELSHPYEVFKKNGIQVDIASPNGGKAPIDPNSLQAEDVQPFKHLADATLKLSAINTDDYAGVFIVGGHGTMYDLPTSKDLQRILIEADSAGKIVASVCHGQAGLINVVDKNGEYLFKSRKLTAFSNAEESQIGLSGVVPFSLEDELTQRGSNYSCGAPWQEHVVVDQNLVTGQNPASAKRMAEVISKMVETASA
ncbi:type 1 glutamine amidotransferase domain-containing protein [Tahibacter amnicola]|uniref:Type 1 glutamine amidotransferase domain-containing protein n=1 Tax=Tahibacter amnicola TaxID=2976241 RepID=A0ABY6BNV6_9GAMM|nr:type 1 glutamine amidotransferase domain-containing protein [Tahibacter amnicola]UXI69477.1 type 1 glutamine amidotransferase domain-containing protein [Tahibacter amnicola]